MNCPKCGTENPNDAKSCWFCSSILTPVSPSGFVQSAKTSGLAIASLVLGILAPFTCFLTAIPAIALGIVALVKIGKGHGQLKGNGLAIAGICVPAVALPLMALLMAILMPALARTRTMAQRVVCASNLKWLGFAIRMYTDDNGQKYPAADKWCDLLKPYYKAEKILVCPSAGQGRCHYAINPQTEPNSPPDIVLLFETKGGWNQSGGPEILTTDNHHGEGCNIVFMDGHVAFVRTAGLKHLRWGGKEDKIVPLEPPPLLPPPPSPPPLRVVPLRGEKGNEKAAPEPNQ